VSAPLLVEGIWPEEEHPAELELNPFPIEEVNGTGPERDFEGAEPPPRTAPEPPLLTHSWMPVDLSVFATSAPAPPAIGGLVYPGRRHVFSGEPETLKTWAALCLVVEQLHSDQVVIWVDFEMGARELLARLRALGVADKELERFVYLAPSEPMTDARVRADVEALLDDRRPSLAIFDAFTGALELHGLDPDKGVQVERFYRTIVQPFQDGGAAAVLLDHVTKNKDARGKYSIASERKLGGADVHLGFESVVPFGRGAKGLAKIATHKDRPGHLPRPKAAELELASDPETGAVTWQFRLGEAGPATGELAFRPTVLMERVSRYVEARVEEELPSRNKVEENVAGKRDYVRQAMDLLLADGYLQEVEGARSARLLRSVKPFREGDDATF
jgi:AAA domain